jgi:hypothetical protein
MEVHQFNPERRFVLVGSDGHESSDPESPRERPSSLERPNLPRILTNGEYEANTRRKVNTSLPSGAAAAAAGMGLAAGLAANTPLSQRRKSMSRPDLPRIDTRNLDDEPTTRTYRAKSATRIEQDSEDYFSPRPKRQSESLLSPQIIKHGSSRREREEKSFDYSRSQNGSNVPPMQRSRSNVIDDRRFDDEYERPAVATLTMKRAASGYEEKQPRRASGDRKSEHSRYREENAPPKKNASPPYSRDRERDRERDGLSRRSSTYKKRDSPPRQAGYSSGEDSKPKRTPSYRRKKSIVTQEDVLLSPAPGRSSNTARSRSRAPPSPNMPQKQFPGEFPSSPRSSFTFPPDQRRPSERPGSIPYPDDESPPRSSRLSVQPTERAAARSRSRAASLKNPIITMPAMPLDIPSGPGSPSERRRSPMPLSPTETRNSLSQSSPRQPFWQPPAFNPSESVGSLERPVGSFRRYSESMNRGGLPDLPDCKRKKGIAGLQDWMGISNCNNFNICPDCYSAVFQNSAFENQFKPFPFGRPIDKPIACDFGSSPWYRIAWLLTLKYRQTDLRLFHSISNATAKAASAGESCSGPRRVNRVWYSIKNPESGDIIPDFNVCYGCKHAVEALLPNLKGVLVHLDSAATPTRGVCAMHFLGSDRRRFILYFDALETTSDTALERGGTPNLQSLAEEIQRLSLYTECREDSVVKNGNWHVMRFLPEFTVCGECFDEAVQPRLNEESSIARGFYVKPQRLPVATCQLYSTRMREIFKKACRTNNPKYLEEKVRERRRIEEDIHAKIVALDERGQNDEETEAEVGKLIQEWRKWE